MTRLLFSFLALALLAGCSTSEILKSSEPRQTIYALHPVKEAPPTESGLARVVEISRPSVPPGFETDRIALYIDGGRTLDYYSGAKWADILDAVLQDFTRQSMTNILPYVVAMSPNEANNANFRLQTKVKEFQPVYGASTSAAPELFVSVEFTLIALPQEDIIGNFTLARRAPATSNDLGNITAELESMMQEIQKEAFGRFDARLRTKQMP